MKVIQINKTDVNVYDSLYVEIIENNKKYILAVVYRPPKQSKETYIMLYDEIKPIIKDKMQ